MNSISQALENSYRPVAGNQKEIADFEHLKFRASLGKIVAIISGRSNQLLDVERITGGKSICSCHYTGMHSVCIDQIKGSEGRSQDFDRNFNPLKPHNCARWVNIAQAWERGANLPAVDLIRIEDVYLVRDGHHRISVAKFKGCDFVDAHVTEWVLENGAQQHGLGKQVSQQKRGWDFFDTIKERFPVFKGQRLDEAVGSAA